MNAPSPTQSKRRQLFGILTGAVLLPALVALAVPDGSSEETEIATIPIAAQSAPVETTPSSTTSTTEAPTTTTTEAPTSTVSVTTTVAKPSTTSTTSTTAAPKPVAYVAPTTTTTVYVPPPPPPAPPVDSGSAAFLACVRQRESRGNYQVVSSNGVYHGAYQFSQSTWNATAQHAGRPDLVGVAPSRVSPADQDAMALALYHWQGKSPWGGHC